MSLVLSALLEISPKYAVPSRQLALIVAFWATFPSKFVDAASRIVTARNVDLCLHGSPGGAVILVNCLESAASNVTWDLDPPHPPKGPLCLKPGPGCLSGALQLGVSDDEWLWDYTTMRIQHGDKCLTAVDTDSNLPAVSLEECESGGHEQNGEGPASQSWILLPTSRPQVDILSELTFPMRASGRYFVDSAGKNVKLVGVNWFGAHMEQLVNNGLDRTTADNIAARILHMGFNSVRLNYALNVTVNSSGSFPDVPDPKYVSGDPSLAGLNVLEVFDKCVEALTSRGLLVIVNVHMLDAAWCCTTTDNNAQWYNDVFSEEDWTASLNLMAARYSGNPRVIGFDLFNEPRLNSITNDVSYWGVWEAGSWLSSPYVRLRDWRVGAAKGAVAVWKGNPDALVIVEGFNFAMHLKYVLSRPMKFAQDCLFSRVAYENHDYSFFDFEYFDWLEYPWSWWTVYQDFKTMRTEANIDKEEIEDVPGYCDDADAYDRFKRGRQASFLFLYTEGKAPVWTGEVGTDKRNDTDCYWQDVLKLYKEFDSSWCYWPVDPIRGPIDNRADTYGLFDAQFKDLISSGWLEVARPHFDSGDTIRLSLVRAGARDLCV
ncbi:unnamed protein product [Prorocentrum cordatum]|uniref:Glycoside hydrolase family 5 domain-containing protein n=1 Tax=Prorocentrum cordatum TaxID=2364126 RepID=A0ABN9WDF1_9DINO|nr:unnamed protein product [Polarella glacialis]